MSVATVRTVVERFLRQRQCTVLALKGAWGVGKTHAWHSLVQDVGKDIWPTTYSYVSLFGVSSLSDLRIAILANSQAADAIGQPLTATSLNRHWARLGLSTTGRLFRRLKNADGTSILKGLSVTLEALAPSFIREMLICFDDFERLGALPPDELMGFISSLKESANCKVAIILNDEQLSGDNNGYQKYREKVVDQELLFNPIPEEAIDWGLPSDLPYRDLTNASALDCGIKNVRVLSRISTVVRLLAPVLAQLHPDLPHVVIRSVVLLGWCHFDRTGGAPRLEFVRTWNTVVSAIKNEKDRTPRPAHEVRWATLLSSYTFGF